ncbi:MAG TPA: ATP-binding protein [Solirubrobacteraceae bacterium]
MIARRLLRVGLRARLTLAFAGAMALLLAALGMFLFARFEANLDHSLDQELRARAEYVRALVLQSDTGLAQAGQASLAAPGERFAQILGPGGRVVDQTPSIPHRSLLNAAQRQRASGAMLTVPRIALPQPAGASRLLAVAVRAQDQRLIVVVGTSLRQRDGTLAEARTVLLLGGPIALVVASLLGYAVAAWSLRTVESMRRRAHELSPHQPGRRLPVPAAGDELSRLAETLNEMLERNEQAFERERAFVADASHELRSPLAIMRAELDAALLGESSPPELRSALTSASEEAERMSELTEDLLVLAQADDGQIALAPEQIPLHEQLERLARRYAPLAQQTGATIEIEAPPELQAWADARWLDRALGNLIENALRHGRGTVRLRASAQPGRLVLAVTDEGPGFTPELLTLAFQRFARGERARTATGAGLGLSIVQAVARAHGGEAQAANAASGGASVLIVIPHPRSPRNAEGCRPGPSEEVREPAAAHHVTSSN